MRAVIVCCVLALAIVVHADEPSTTDPPLASKSKQVQLFLPTEVFEKRSGDVKALGEYIVALDKTTAMFFKDGRPPKAKGLLIAVVVKPSGQARAWCESVEGEAPRETLAKLEEALAKATPPKVVDGPIAFGMEIHFAGEEPKEFPKLPAVWIDAMTKAGKPIQINDDVFPLIWPE